MWNGSVAVARIGWSYYQKHTSRDARALSNLPTFFNPLHTGTLEASGTTQGKSRTWSGSHRNSRTSRDTAWESTGREGPDESMTASRTSLRDADAIQPSGSNSRCSAFLVLQSTLLGGCLFVSRFSLEAGTGGFANACRTSSCNPAQVSLKS